MSLIKKNRNLPAVQRKPKKRGYHDIYSDDGVESGDKFSKTNSESGNEDIVKKTKKAQTRKRTVAKTKIEPATKKKEEKTTKRNCKLYKQLIQEVNEP